MDAPWCTKLFSLRIGNTTRFHVTILLLQNVWWQATVHFHTFLLFILCIVKRCTVVVQVFTYLRWLLLLFPCYFHIRVRMNILRLKRRKIMVLAHAREWRDNWQDTTSAWKSWAGRGGVVRSQWLCQGWMRFRFGQHFTLCWITLRWKWDQCAIFYHPRATSLSLIIFYWVYTIRYTNMWIVAFLRKRFRGAWVLYWELINLIAENKKTSPKF